MSTLVWVNAYMPKKFNEIFSELVGNRFRSQSDAARAIGISQQQVNRYMNGKVLDFPRLDTAVKIAKALGVTLETLAGTEMNHASLVREARTAPYGLPAYPTDDIESALAAVSQAEASLAQAKTALKQARKQMGGKKAGQH